MAMTTCRECGKELSSKASKCPHCGVRHRRSFGTVLFAVGLSVVALLWIIGRASTTATAAHINAVGPTTAAGIVHAPVDNSKWTAVAGKNPVDDSPTMTLLLVADSGVSRLGSPVALVLRCQSRKLEAYVNWNSYLGMDDASVTDRIGAAPARTRDWSLSTDKEASFYPGDVRALVRDLSGSPRYVAVVTPYNENPITAIFTTAGLDSLAPRLFAGCAAAH